MLGIVASPDIWRFQPHPEVWVLVAGLATLYTYAIKVIGPRAVPAGQPVVRRRQVGCFIAGLTILWLASTGRCTTSPRSTSTRRTCSST